MEERHGGIHKGRAIVRLGLDGGHGAVVGMRMGVLRSRWHRDDG